MEMQQKSSDVRREMQTSQSKLYLNLSTHFMFTEGFDMINWLKVKPQGLLSILKFLGTQ